MLKKAMTEKYKKGENDYEEEERGIFASTIHFLFHTASWLIVKFTFQMK